MENFAFVVLRTFYSSKTFTHIANEDTFIAETTIVLFFAYLEKFDIAKFICIVFNMDLLVLFNHIGYIQIYKAYQGDVSFELMLFSCIICRLRL